MISREHCKKMEFLELRFVTGYITVNTVQLLYILNDLVDYIRKGNSSLYSLANFPKFYIAPLV